MGAGNRGASAADAAQARPADVGRPVRRDAGEEGEGPLFHAVKRLNA